MADALTDKFDEQMTDPEAERPCILVGLPFADRPPVRVLDCILNLPGIALHLTERLLPRTMPSTADKPPVDPIPPEADRELPSRSAPAWRLPNCTKSAAESPVPTLLGPRPISNLLPSLTDPLTDKSEPSRQLSSTETEEPAVKEAAEKTSLPIREAALVDSPLPIATVS